MQQEQRLVENAPSLPSGSAGPLLAPVLPMYSSRSSGAACRSFFTSMLRALPEGRRCSQAGILRDFSYHPYSDASVELQVHLSRQTAEKVNNSIAASCNRTKNFLVPFFPENLVKKCHTAKLLRLLQCLPDSTSFKCPLTNHGGGPKS